MNNSLLGPVVLDVEGHSLTEREEILLKHPYVGGVIFFLRNFDSPEQIATLVQQIRTFRPNILIAVDQEGGRVQRFKNGFTRLPSLQVLANAYVEEESYYYQNDQVIKDAAWLMASELITVGVDISFAPVVDVDDHFSKVIGDRSFSKNVETVSRLGKLYIEGMHEAGMASTLKHFPGHGAVQADSHLDLPDDKRTFDSVLKSDLIPFSRLLPLSEGVMPAHLLFSNIDSLPVGFSSYWLNEVLRGKMKYQGVIFSDDLSMEGASVAGSYKDRAIAALSAGCDAILVCNNAQGAEEVLDVLQDQNWPIDNKLSLMRLGAASNNMTLAELKSTDRWQKIVNIVQELECRNV